MKPLQEFFATFDWNAFLQQFLYDSKNPLLFNNGFFVYFFTLFILLFFALRNHHKARRYVFCIFSLYFFYKASGWFVGLVLVSAVVDFFLSNAIYREKSQSRKKFLLVLSILFNLGMLFYFKYTDFFIEISNSLFDTNFNPLNLILPIGISFYTFENLSYTVDVYRGEFKPANKFSDYLLFLAFFPKLMMGPIVRAHDFVPQINEPYVISERDFAKGFFLIISGFLIWFFGAVHSDVDTYIKENRLKTDGIYAWTRNPMYTGWWFVLIGILLLFHNLWTLLLIPLQWAILSIVLKRTEEQWLKELFGEEYERYCKKVNRLLPYKHK